MDRDDTSLFDRLTSAADDSQEKARTNVEKLSDLLGSEEDVDAHTGEKTAQLKSIGFRGVVAATTAAGVMSITGLMHPEKVGEVQSSPEASASIEEIVQSETSALETPSLQDRQTPLAEVDAGIQEASWWHDAPTLGQQDLTYNGRETNYGRAPTAVSMVTEYWHRLDPDNETRSAQALLDKNVEQGVFDSRGMSVTGLHDELLSMGYEAKDYADADLGVLKREVDKGPVIVTVKLGMEAQGTPHSVVVTGISETGEVRVNDPWTGAARTYRWERFRRSWGSKFPDVSSRSHLTAIRPL